MCSIGIQVSVTTISASSSTSGTPPDPTPKVAITIRCAPATAFQRVSSRSKRAAMRRCRVSSLTQQEGKARQLLDHELLARACSRKLFDLADEQHEPARARGA